MTQYALYRPMRWASVCAPSKGVEGSARARLELGERMEEGDDERGPHSGESERDEEDGGELGRSLD